MSRADLLKQRGSVLLMVPAAVLVLVVLGAIAVDSAVVFLAQRELSSATAAAANDAAGAAFASAPFYGAGAVALDANNAQTVATASMRARASREVEMLGSPRVVVDGARLCVEADARVRRVFGTAIPGVRRFVMIHARSAASLVRAEGEVSGAAC